MDRTRFYRALQEVRERDLDLTGWLEFFVEGLATQLAEVKTAGEVAIRRDVLVRTHRLNARPADALEHVLRTGRLDIRTSQLVAQVCRQLCREFVASS